MRTVIFPVFCLFLSVFATLAQNAPPQTTTSVTGGETIRIPQNIRVLLTNGSIVVVPLETYVARSLSQEWFSTWGNYEGGMNALKAGAVAIRSYAVSFINTTMIDEYDICATTSCQVYRETASTNAQIAALETAGYVLVSSSNTIVRSEYAAENNSLGFSCGDGFTQPVGGCFNDPVCAGEKRFGHGRGMCQWGTAKWATGLKMAGNGGTNYPANADSGIKHGLPRKDWIEILKHYYPSFALVKASPLEIGDQVKLVGSLARTNFNCPDDGIGSGVLCSQEKFVKAVGSKGIIVKGPEQVSSDGKNYTWCKVVWDDLSSGWIQENWLERDVPVPSAPTDLQATLASGNQVDLKWKGDPSPRLSYKIERSVNAPSNWVEIQQVPANVTSFSDRTILPASINYYRVCAFNLGGRSPYSKTVDAGVPDSAPVLAAITNPTAQRGVLLTISNSATASDFFLPIADFENCANKDVVMFRSPAASMTTQAHVKRSPNVIAVTDSFPSNSAVGSRVLHLNWSFKTGTTNPWVRVSTLGTGRMPNPVIDLKKKLRFNIYADKALKVAVGCRETITPAGTALGSDGGMAGTIEFAGARAKNPGEQPEAIHAVKAKKWTTVTFDFPNEPVVGFTGDGVLSTQSGLAVLEHLAFVPSVPFKGSGSYNVYLDNFMVVQPKTLKFSLAAGAPAGAAINAETGVFTWTPTQAHPDGNYPITVQVTDNATPPQTDQKTFTVTVVGKNALAGP